QLVRHFEHEPEARVAATAVAQARHALAAQPQQLLRLAARGDLERHPSLRQRGHLDLVPEGQLGERDGQLAEQIGLAPHEDLVLLHAHDHVEVAGRPAVDAARSLAADAQLHAVVDAGGDLHRQHALGRAASLAATPGARRLVVLALAPTLRTRPGEGHEALRRPDLAAALAHVARRALGARLAPVTSAVFARLHAGDLDLRLDPGGRLLER